VICARLASITICKFWPNLVSAGIMMIANSKSGQKLENYQHFLSSVKFCDHKKSSSPALGEFYLSQVITPEREILFI
jgi:hypothetical protein